MTSFNQTRRDSSPKSQVKSVITGQKPSCFIQIFRYLQPNETSLAMLNVDSSGASNNTDISSGVSTIDNDIVKCAIHKNKGSSSGGFSLILKRGNKGDVGDQANRLLTGNDIDYLKLISPGDWIAIYMRTDDNIVPGSNGENSGLKMLGIVENVRYIEVDDPATGRPRFEYVVTGRDFGKVFENQIYFNPVINSLSGIENVIAGRFITYAKDAVTKRTPESPDEICRALISYFLATGDNTLAASTPLFKTPSELRSLFPSATGKFGELLDTSFIGLQHYKNEKLTSVDPLLGQALVLSLPPSGTIWSYIQMYSNPCLNEMFVDLANKNGRLVPTLQLRQIPFSHSANDKTNPFNSSGYSSSVAENEKTLFRALPRHKIKSTDIKQKNIGKSQFERVNAVVVVPQIPESSGQEIRAAYGMMFNSPSVQKYGLSLLRLNTFFTIGSDFKSFAKKCTELVTDFFMNAHAFYNGTIVTDGTNNFVQVGQNLFIEDVKQLFHIDGISYMYEIDQTTGATRYDTEFRVSHGQGFSNNRLEFIGDPSSGSRDKSKPERLEYNTISAGTLENIRNVKK